MTEDSEVDFNAIFGLKGSAEVSEQKEGKSKKKQEKPEEEKPVEEKPADNVKTADDLFRDFQRDLDDDEELLELMRDDREEKNDFEEVKKEIESPKTIKPEEKKKVVDESPGIVLREGQIEIPSDSKVHFIRKDGKIAVVVCQRDGDMQLDGEIIDLKELGIGEGLSFEAEGDRVEDILKSIQESSLAEGGWVDEAKGDEFIGDIKGDINLLDLRKEFMERVDEEEELEEEEFEEEEGLLDRIKGFVKKTAVESREEKLRRMTLDNLERTHGMRDRRKATVAVACVLKEFLQIKFGIERELTYMELIQELRERDISKKLRNSLIRFFKSTSIMMYANIEGAANHGEALNLAKRTVEELS
ncbi:MAG: hypothetical protein B6U97_02175 [Candidatus Altiarchaeales archaeon ex4484_96]|nr:MAG: hypothetical protein B6U97_02175 [Candidatus Altiarchaeales archaeon ex4484_96]